MLYPLTAPNHPNPVEPDGERRKNTVNAVIQPPRRNNPALQLLRLYFVISIGERNFARRGDPATPLPRRQNGALELGFHEVGHFLRLEGLDQRLQRRPILVLGPRGDEIAI